MSWGEHHTESERLATEAQVAARNGQVAEARKTYLLAAEAELKALSELDRSKPRTLGVTAVSAIALLFKAGSFQEAEATAHKWLGSGSLPPFAYDQLREILEHMWSIESLRATGIEFTGTEVLVSVSGGEVVRGGAPLDLILQKVEQVSAMFYRTAEMLLKVPHRKRGVPDPQIRDACRPWLFQTTPGSYQFAVRVQKPSQGTLFPELQVQVEQVSHQFLSILRAASVDPEHALKDLVPDDSYRETFLKLTRNLAPAGKTCSRLSIRSALCPEAEPIVFQVESRDALRSALKKEFPRKRDTEDVVHVQLRGVLRALHLDEDWIELAIRKDDKEEHVRIENAGDEVDDMLGPMVNHEVMVEATQTKAGKYRLKDIQGTD